MLRAALRTVRQNVRFALRSRASLKAAEWRGSTWAAEALTSLESASPVYDRVDSLGERSQEHRAFDRAARMTADRWVRLGRISLVDPMWPAYREQRRVQ